MPVMLVTARGPLR